MEGCRSFRDFPQLQRRLPKSLHSDRRKNSIAPATRPPAVSHALERFAALVRDRPRAHRPKRCRAGKESLTRPALN